MKIQEERRERDYTNNNLGMYNQNLLSGVQLQPAQQEVEEKYQKTYFRFKAFTVLELSANALLFILLLLYIELQDDDSDGESKQERQETMNNNIQIFCRIGAALFLPLIVALLSIKYENRCLCILYLLASLLTVFFWLFLIANGTMIAKTVAPYVFMLSKLVGMYLDVMFIIMIGKRSSIAESRYLSTNNLTKSRTKLCYL